ncbi:hypothetical protein CDV31_000940 [Fusarium ambrosium]|uniref:Uncharacterized protein n=1 Tax=Fusarium ambrosium TaxID=131363 RepID=A0A428V0S0_9HYPO|nr:hypothetical protein CDV31_000940 [Fusarium ambrosium]
MSSPIQNKANSYDYDDESEMTPSEILGVEKMKEICRIARKQHEDNIKMVTKTKTNHIDCDETWSSMNNAADSENGREACLTTTNGKLQFSEPSTRRIYLAEFKQWLRDECRTVDKKKEWMKWLMEIPLDPSELDGTCKTPFSDLESALKRSLFDLRGTYADMEFNKKDRDDRLVEALHMDFMYRSAKRDVEYYNMVIKKSLENDDESGSQG